MDVEPGLELLLRGLEVRPGPLLLELELQQKERLLGLELETWLEASLQEPRQ
jgi:hypothetical protein